MKKIVILSSFLFVITGCITDKKIGDKKEYLRWVGDIEQNNDIDAPDFKVCNGDEKIVQYFNMGKGPTYAGEKTKIINTFNTKYKAIAKDSQNGLIRIRFVVNCEGKAGRFRILQADYDYNEIQFDERIVSQLVEITKEVKEWEILSAYGVQADYYFYLIFKINNGRLTEILP